MIRWATFIVAAAGLTLGVYTAATARHDAPKAPLAGEPSVNPYAHGIAATGQVEAATRNVPIGSPEGGLVMKVLVEVGQEVKAGDPLFELDSRPLQSDLLKARAAKEAAEAALKRIQAQPRAEDLPPLEATVRGAEAEVADWTDQYNRYGEAQAQVASGDYEKVRRKYLLDGAKARLAVAQAKLALAKAGAWTPDIDVAKADVAQADANMKALEMLIDRRTVRAPIDATILKRNIEPGQFAAADPAYQPIVLGDLRQLNIRARVDEEDLPMLRAGAKAQARVRGQKAVMVPLSMIRIEPLAEPKTQLSGSTTERVDTRVLEVMFKVDDLSIATLYPGQLLDVFIDGAGD